MGSTAQRKQPVMSDVQSLVGKAASIKHQPKSQRYYFDVGIGSVCLSGADTRGAFCLLEGESCAGHRRASPHTHARG